MRAFHSGLGVLTLSLAFMGCHKEVTREDPDADSHVDINIGYKEVTEASEAFKVKLSNYHIPDSVVNRYEDHKVVCQLMRIKNETDEHFNVHLLSDRVREILTDSDKVIFMTATEDIGEEKESENYQQQTGEVKAGQQIKAGQKAGAYYSVRGRIANIRKGADGVQENTMVFTLELHDKEQGVSPIVITKPLRLRKS